MAGWLNQLKLTRAADAFAKLIAFLAPGVIAIVGGLMLPNCLPLNVLSSLTFPAVVAFADEAPRPPLVAAQFPPDPSWTTKARCLRVIDGDTIEVEVRRVIRVRMLDCWAPESKLDPRISQADRETEKFAGQASKENLRRLAEGRDVIVQIPAGEDVAKSITMGRWLGNVWLEGDGESLAEKQVKGGFADRVKPEKVR